MKQDESIKKYLQKRFINLLVKGLFNGIEESDVLDIRQDGKVFYKKKQMGSDTILRLKENVEVFQRSILWDVLKNGTKHACNLRMFDKGYSEDDILAGKLGLYIVDVFERILEDIKKLK